MKTAENKKADAKTHFANPHFSFSAVIFLKRWYATRDSNPHAEAAGPKPAVSANFTSRAQKTSITAQNIDYFRKIFH